MQAIRTCMRVLLLSYYCSQCKQLLPVRRKKEKGKLTCPGAFFHTFDIHYLTYCTLLYLLTYRLTLLYLYYLLLPFLCFPSLSTRFSGRKGKALIPPRCVRIHVPTLPKVALMKPHTINTAPSLSFLPFPFSLFPFPFARSSNRLV